MHTEVLRVTIPYPHLGEATPRTPGVHVSGLIRGMAGQYGLLDKKYLEDFQLVEVAGEAEQWWGRLDDVSRLRMSMGLAWEDWYLPRMPGVVYKPGEMQLEGVYMTHDGESLDTIVTDGNGRVGSVLTIHEVKLTYKSLNTITPIETQWMWLMQTKAYCKARGARVCYLHVLCVCGDYSYPIQPLLMVYRIEFTQTEVDEAWQLILGYLQQQRQLGRV